MMQPRDALGEQTRPVIAPIFTLDLLVSNNNATESANVKDLTEPIQFQLPVNAEYEASIKNDTVGQTV